MLLDAYGQAQPAIGRQPHWTRFTNLTGQLDLCDPLEAVKLLDQLRESMKADTSP